MSEFLKRRGGLGHGGGHHGHGGGGGWYGGGPPNWYGGWGYSPYPSPEIIVVEAPAAVALAKKKKPWWALSGVAEDFSNGLLSLFGGAQAPNPTAAITASVAVKPAAAPVVAAKINDDSAFQAWAEQSPIKPSSGPWFGGAPKNSPPASYFNNKKSSSSSTGPWVTVAILGAVAYLMTRRK